jgi:hypothetical protein
LNTIGEKEKLFGDEGERSQVPMTVFVVVATVVVEEFDDRFPTIIR